jgi:hypothetical protein
MPREIIIISDPTSFYWEDENAFVCCEVTALEWESLFYVDLDLESLNDKQMDRLSADFPLIFRTDDFYRDAVFERDEVISLVEEIHRLALSLQYEDSRRYLAQLEKACELALKNKAGIQIIAD